MVKNTIKTQISDVQIHHPNYLANNEIEFYIKESNEIIDRIIENDTVISACQRTKSFGMASTATKGVGVMINGVIPEQEKTVTNLFEKIKEGKGTYFESKRKNRIIIGEKLAEKLHLKVKSKIVLTFQDFNGNITGASFKVEGIYATHNSVFDEQNVYVNKVDLDRELNMPKNTSHEIAVLLDDHDQSAIMVSSFKKMLPDYLVEAWFDIDPYLKLTSSLTAYMLFIFMSIILLALGFAIVNTMLMVILERTKELGMIMAIGMNRFKVFKMIMFETIILAILGGLIGLAISWVFTWYYGDVGIDISSVGEGFGSLGYGSVMYPLLEWSDYVEVIIMVLITGIIASIFPTIRALKMKPAEATRA